MKISVHVSSDKSLRLHDSTESAEGITTQDYKERREVTQRRSKKKKSWRKKIVLISSAIYFIYIICLVLVFIFHFILIHFSSYPRLSTCYSRLSTLDTRHLDTLFLLDYSRLRNIISLLITRILLGLRRNARVIKWLPSL